jgi:hypothetical protein
MTTKNPGISHLGRALLGTAEFVKVFEAGRC